ncbi:MAG: ABC transporter substrate-binding protein [Phycisphaerales bacterium]
MLTGFIAGTVFGVAPAATESPASSIPVTVAEANHTADPYVIWIDADFSVAAPAAHAIEAGVRTALHSSGNTLAGHPVIVMPVDHHGNARRSQRNLQRAAADPRTIAVIGGIHSPPLLANQALINAEQLLLLNPWAAAGPITRPEGDDNWIYRLSIDDALAGPFLVQEAIQRHGEKLVLLAEETGWGRSNERSMGDAFTAATGQSLDVFTFSWDIGQLEAQVLIDRVIASEPDAIIYVGNVSDAGPLFGHIARQPVDSRPAIVSHWGITSGRLHDAADADELDALDLTFLQTRWRYAPENPACAFEAAWAIAREHVLETPVVHPQDLGPPTGFVHAYDITKLLLAAAEQSAVDQTPSGRGQTDRPHVRNALQNLHRPVKGILKTYDRPFRPWSLDQSASPDRCGHEALSKADYTLGRFDVQQRIVIDGTPRNTTTDQRSIPGQPAPASPATATATANANTPADPRR